MLNDVFNVQHNIFSLYPWWLSLTLHLQNALSRTWLWWNWETVAFLSKPVLNLKKNPKTERIFLSRFLIYPFTAENMIHQCGEFLTLMNHIFCAKSKKLKNGKDFSFLIFNLSVLLQKTWFINVGSFSHWWIIFFAVNRKN